MFKGLSGLSSLWSQDMAIDLGTANTGSFKRSRSGFK